MQGTGRRLAGGAVVLLLVVLLGAEAAPPFFFHHLAHHLKGSDDHRSSDPTVVYVQPPPPPVYAQPTAPVYAQSTYYPSRLPERLVIQVDPGHHRNMPGAMSQTVHVDNQGHGEVGGPVRVRTQAAKGSALPPHQTFVQVKVADPTRTAGSVLAASAPSGASAAAAPAASAAAASAAAASVNAFQHFAGLNGPALRPAHVLGASGEEWLSELPVADLRGFPSPHGMTRVFKRSADVPSHL